ncbi:MAG: hypothetical protein WC674_06060 [Candidatus Krumholzibacteriia bacterium]
MKTLPARRLALAALALALLWICSCSEDTTCPTCPKPAVCHDPSKALLGSWVVFESTLNGNPDLIYMGMQWDFRDDDTLIVATTSDPYVWSANDSMLFMMSTPSPTEFMAFRYEFEADTLNLRGMTGIPFTVYWRFHRMP